MFPLFFLVLLKKRKKKKKGLFYLLPTICYFTVTLCPTFLSPFWPSFSLLFPILPLFFLQSFLTLLFSIFFSINLLWVMFITYKLFYTILYTLQKTTETVTWSQDFPFAITTFVSLSFPFSSHSSTKKGDYSLSLSMFFFLLVNILFFLVVLLWV